MSLTASKSTYYAFCADQRSNHTFHYRSYSWWRGTKEHGREVREVSPVDRDSFTRSIRRLGWNLLVLEKDSQIPEWIDAGGWALAEKEFAERFIGPLMACRTCVKSPLGLFLDKRLPKTSSRRIKPEIRELVYRRDSHCCVRCGCTDLAQLTLQHAIPFSRGGASTECNLVTMCEPCNQNVGNNFDYGCLSLAGLHSGWDPKIMGREASPDSWREASNISDNIVVSFVETRELASVFSTGKPMTTASD